MRTAKLNKSYVDTKINIQQKNAAKIKALENEIEEMKTPAIFKGKTEAERANIFWKHAFPVLNQ